MTSAAHDDIIFYVIYYQCGGPYRRSLKLEAVGRGAIFLLERGRLPWAWCGIQKSFPRGQTADETNREIHRAGPRHNGRFAASCHQRGGGGPPESAAQSPVCALVRLCAAPPRSPLTSRELLLVCVAPLNSGAYFRCRTSGTARQHPLVVDPSLKSPRTRRGARARRSGHNSPAPRGPGPFCRAFRGLPRLGQRVRVPGIDRDALLACLGSQSVRQPRNLRTLKGKSRPSPGRGGLHDSARAPAGLPACRPPWTSRIYRAQARWNSPG